jgi:hypothetical protein
MYDRPSHYLDYPCAEPPNEKAFVNLVPSNDITNEVWIAAGEPLDLFGGPIQLYLYRFVEINDQYLARVVGFGIPRHGYVWILMQLLDSAHVHGMLIKETWVGLDLLERIDRVEGGGGRTLFWEG